MKPGRHTVSDHDRAVGTAVRKARKAAGLTQPELAEAVGITYQQLGKYETGMNRISAGRLYTIAQALGLPIEYFYAEFEAVEAKEQVPPEFTRLDKRALRLLNALAEFMLEQEAA